MSTFSELSALVQESHDAFLSSDFEYRPTRDDSWSPIRARKYNERIEPRKNSTGWSRVNLVDFSIAKSDLDQVLIHSTIRQEEGQAEFTVIELKAMTTDRWIVTCQLTRAGEISRPKLRRD